MTTTEERNTRWCHHPGDGGGTAVVVSQAKPCIPPVGQARRLDRRVRCKRASRLIIIIIIIIIIITIIIIRSHFGSSAKSPTSQACSRHGLYPVGVSLCTRAVEVVATETALAFHAPYLK